jgi:hypothetical protein
VQNFAIPLSLHFMSDLPQAKRTGKSSELERAQGQHGQQYGQNPEADNNL